MNAFLKVLISVCLCAPAAYSDLLIRDITVVDVKTGSEVPHQSILIRRDRIVAVGNHVAAPKDSQVVNGAGKYAIPGLWDMRVHLSSEKQLGHFLSQGITGVRDMGGDLALMKQWREQIQAGTMLGPHIETCGSPMDGFPSEEAGMPVTVVRSPSEARAAFDRLDDQHADFIGILPRLPRDAYFALAERARKWYSSVAGAVPETVSASEAVDARQKSFDDLHGIALACSEEEKKLREPSALALERHDWAAFATIEARALDTFSPDKANTLFERMAMFDTRVAPVLVNLRSSQCCGQNYAKLTNLIPRMKSGGVAILAGSGNGADLHRELELLVEAGLTPAAALRSATIDAARLADSDESLGSIEDGRIADLVVLNANPLTDIGNTRKIAGVIVAGKYLPAVRVRK